MQTIEERAQEFYNSFFDMANIHLMDVAEGIKKPNAAELEEYGDHMKNYPEDTALEAIQGYGMYKETIYYIILAGGGPAALRGSPRAGNFLNSRWSLRPS